MKGKDHQVVICFPVDQTILGRLIAPKHLADTCGTLDSPVVSMMDCQLKGWGFKFSTGQKSSFRIHWPYSAKMICWGRGLATAIICLGWENEVAYTYGCLRTCSKDSFSFFLWLVLAKLLSAPFLSPFPMQESQKESWWSVIAVLWDKQQRMSCLVEIIEVRDLLFSVECVLRQLDSCDTVLIN